MPTSTKRRRFRVRLSHRNIPRAQFLADLRRAARMVDGRPLTMRAYAEHGKFEAVTIMRHFGTWNAALQAANLPVSRLYRAPRRLLMENLANVWRKLGRQPTVGEMLKRNGLSQFHGLTYCKRFGSWHKVLKAFERFVNGLGDFAELPCGTRSRRARSTRTPNWRLRATVLIRDNCLCLMCGASPAKDPDVTLHVDHIVPWSKGGKTVLANLQTLCARCNIGKGDLGALRQVSPSR